ncbi:t-SNARE syntaxin TLG2 [Aspergillus ruber CBS 135680]|uniref:t-SNARE n=1 Tax=Aspergillus ruber (strain CBS 135680) TaxID=1388766 RepID=A0A017SSF3_ASPRC|nr:t-SNARE [Aspergillus ruber CBS 135680]EYE99903.1 t-SNARE [Aspergillus ruber CBS 135680]
MWRDRTNLYISYRQSFAHHPAKKPRNTFPDPSTEPEESRRLISSTEDYGDAIIEMDILPPRWVDIQDEVTEQLADIAQQSSQLDKLHHKHLLPSFGDEGVRRQEEGAIERLTQDITRGFHECQKAVQRIEIMVQEAKMEGRVSAGDETMAKNIQISLAARVQDASARFRKKQSTYLKKLRGLEGVSSPFDRTPTPTQMQNPYTDPSLMESDADKSFSQTTLMQTQQRQRRTGQNDAAIEQREREINDIAKGIIELSDIFRELQTMIIDQGTMLDRIDYNVERMGTEVKAADKELNVATNYQRRTTKRKILLLLIIIVAGLIIVLLVKPKNNNFSAPAPPTPPSSNNMRRAGEMIYRRRRWYPNLTRMTRDRIWIDPDRPR